jgi:hypothetical protein
LFHGFDKQRAYVLAIVDGLGNAALRRAVFPSGWTYLGLIRHLAVDDEQYWFRRIAAEKAPCSRQSTKSADW